MRGSPLDALVDRHNFLRSEEEALVIPEYDPL